MLKTLEALIGLLLIFIFFFFYFRQEAIELEKIGLEVKALNAIKTLDEANELRKYVLLNDSSSIENRLDELLVPYKTKVLICGEDCKYQGSEEKGFSLIYLIAGDVDNFAPRKIIVWVGE